jgi:hypothetical protein
VEAIVVTLEPGCLYRQKTSDVQRLIISAEPPWNRHQIVTFIQMEPGVPMTLVVRCEVWRDDWRKVSR